MNEDILKKVQGFKDSLKSSQNKFQQYSGIRDSELKKLKAYKLNSIYDAKKQVALTKDAEDKLLKQLDQLAASFEKTHRNAND
jgi:hypothetical protein